MGWTRLADGRRGTIDSVVLAVEIVIVIAVVFTVAALAVGRFDRMDPAAPDSSSVGLPAGGAVTATDVAHTRFAVALRGYHMAEVDAVLLRLAEELAWRDDEIARRDEELVRLASFARIGATRDAPRSAAAPVDTPGVHTPGVHTPGVHTPIVDAPSADDALGGDGITGTPDTGSSPSPAAPLGALGTRGTRTAHGPAGVVEETQDDPSPSGVER
ncbi:DivIVA domain-containing protein [Frankia sp. AgPm24]|uniref:DivIVA domain-containing protein n=1 Tax=Frankia sp. AgPm24 TaxID=631128 RepID=UPI00200E9EEE|nr:DivIVA domain-containing protein [Frankia sp. AgPm24]MCK9925013.1 DivIVA domain-containing protein [Frankia sp. AgPm24]